MITVPVNVLHPAYLWHLDLCCYAHRSVYGTCYQEKIYSAIVKQLPISFNLRYPVVHKICEPWSNDTDLMSKLSSVESGLCVPLNIQTGLRDIIDAFDDSAVIELIDHDMMHFRRHPEITVADSEFLVCDVYEKWHLLSLTDHRRIIDHFVDNRAEFYNGGFVPIIGRVGTFKKILADWIDIHVSILTKDPPEPKRTIGWWAGMYAFNAACEKNRVRMTAKNYCYIPGINDLTDDMYIAHYSVDPRFNKKRYPDIDPDHFLDNDFYRLIKNWLMLH